MKITDIAFDDAVNVIGIKYRLHPIDVGFDLRAEDTPVAVSPTDDPMRVSYPAADGSRRVMEGPQPAVVARLRKLGFRFLEETA